MRVSNIPEAWSEPVTLTAAEIWQCDSGSIRVTASANPDPGDGIRLDFMSGIPIPAGKTVRFRRIGGGAAVLIREALI